MYWCELNDERELLTYMVWWCGGCRVLLFDVIERYMGGQ